MLKTKCILAPMSVTDGVRISIMSKHTLNDGITLDGRITSDIFDEHKPIYAPPLTLIGAYYRSINEGIFRTTAWNDFEKGYLLYLDNINEAIDSLALSARNQNITIMCIEKTPDYCHRRLLAERIKELYSNLEVKIE